MPTDKRLDALLRELEEIWRSAGDTATVQGLRPGVTESEIRKRTSHTVEQLPSEAISWFAWHDGHDGGRAGRGPYIGGSHMLFLTLEAANRLYASRLNFARDFRKEHSRSGVEMSWAEAGWDPTWYPLFVGESGDVAGIDCSGSRLGVPIRVVEVIDDDRASVDAASLTDVVADWISLYERGFYVFRDGVWFTEDSVITGRQPPWS